MTILASNCCTNIKGYAETGQETIAQE
jgi:hypothetical protein